MTCAPKDQKNFEALFESFTKDLEWGPLKEVPEKKSK